jgi:hypothetical protein
MDKKARIALVTTLFLVGILIISLTVAKGPKVKECNDGIDNDGDGDIDLADAGCDNKRDNDETNCGDGVCEGGETSGSCPQDCGVTECNDGIDNDGDTYTDYPNDPGCTSTSDTSELGTVQCDDGIDNTDADTLIDYPDDVGCSSPSDNYEVDGHCDDTSDNDNDGYIDYPNDPECTSYASKEGNCVDSDGGFVAEIQGTASGSTGGNPYNHTDYCLDSVTLKEYYCTWVGNVDSYNMDCSLNATGTCVNGACIY